MQKLFLFNLEIDLDSPVLAASHDWTESFARLYSEVNVVSTHLGRTLLPINVSLRELGGGSIRKRLNAMLRLAKCSLEICKKRKTSVVMHHMSTYTAVILGPFIRLMGVKQGLWYSHSVSSFTLKASSLFVNYIFSSSPEALPMNTEKARFIGHGIKINRFVQPDLNKDQRDGIVSIGRYAKIKNFEGLLELSSSFTSTRFDIFGPCSDDYKQVLQNEFANANLNVHLHDAIKYDEIPKTLFKYEFFYSGTPKSVDKAVIEAALAGCFILTLNSTTIELTGMEAVWKKIGVVVPSTIQDQLNTLRNYAGDKSELRLLLQKSSAIRNDVDRLTSRIALTLSESNEVFSEDFE